MSNENNSNFENIDPWFDELGKYYLHEFTTNEILEKYLGIEIKDAKQHQKRLADVMKKLGYEKKLTTLNGRRSQYWLKNQVEVKTTNTDQGDQGQEKLDQEVVTLDNKGFQGSDQGDQADQVTLDTPPKKHKQKTI